MEQQNEQIVQIPPEKPKGCGCGCLGALFWFFLIIVLIVVIVIGIFLGISEWNKKKEYNMIYEDMKANIYLETEDLSEILKQSSDIEGMTVEDKLEAGLNGSTGSDTDGDGLTDQEELEIYGSDPLLFSTSGDVFGDGYKVVAGLDLTQSYDGSMADLDYFNDFENITPVGNEAADVLGVFEEVDYKLSGASVIKAYRIYDFNGTVTIDFSEYISNTDEVAVFLVTDEETKILEDATDIENVTVMVDSSSSSQTIIGIINVTTGSFASSNLGDAEITSTTTFDPDTESRGDLIIIYSPFASFFLGEDIIIVEESGLLSEEKEDEDFANYIQAQMSILLDSNVGVTHHYVNSAVMQQVDNVMSKMYALIVSTCTFEETSFSDYVLQYNKYSWIEYKNYISTSIADKILADEKAEENSSVEDVVVETAAISESGIITSFDAARDIFPFANFSSYISYGGNCAGFAQICAMLFNGSLYSRTDTYITNDGVELTYDLSDSSFDTIFDAGLYDFTSSTYLKLKYQNGELDTESLIAEEDIELVRFIGLYCTKLNDSLSPTASEAVSYYYFLNQKPTFTMIEYLEEELAQNKIVSLGLRTNGMSHAITVYGIEYDENDPNKMTLLVYDSNFPNSTYTSINPDIESFSVGNRIEITKYKKNILNIWADDSSEYCFSFSYAPTDAYPDYYFENSGAIFRFELIDDTMTRIYDLSEK